MAKETVDQATLFHNVDNLVLQGGGIKGISYLGTLQQLLEENPSFLNNLKRVAGNSAGSIAAMYIALNLDPYTDMNELMSRNYLDLLDDGLALKVAINITSWFGKYKYKNFLAKDIFIAAYTGFTDLQTMLENPADQEKVQKLLTEMFTNILQYYSSKLGSAYSVFMRAGASTIAEHATNWIMSILKPKANLQVKVQTNLRTGFENETLRSAIPVVDEDTNNTNSSTEYKFNFEQLLRDTFNKVAQEAKIVESEVISFDRNANSEKPKSMMGGYQSNEATQTEDEKDLAQVKEEDVQFYKSQRQQPIADIADKSDLTGATLHYAIAELLWFILVSQIGADGLKEEFGLFTGDIVKRELIENAIKLAFTKL